jgi:unsaturated chondroitin disaccharide hydrolase
LIQFIHDTDLPMFQNALDFAGQQMRRLLERHPDLSPMYTDEGKWLHNAPAWTRWCDGFMPGIMWILARHAAFRTRDASDRDYQFWVDHAIRHSKPLEEQKRDLDVHDLGFIFLSTFYRWYNITRDPAIREVVFEAGRTLAEHFHESGQYLRSYVAEDSIFIDIMMNVGLIFYTARETNDKRLRDIAVRHCLTTRRFLVRADGSTAHEGLFDPATGEFLRQTTQQGFRGDSCWSRGLAWSLYGFSHVYEYSRDPRFLSTAESCADYYITHSPADGVPPWDFNAPPENRSLTDSSAAAIAAAGLLRLCRLIADPIKGHFYWSTAIHILRGLCTKFLAINDPGWEGILKGGVYHLHKGLGVDESVMWGEYFFCEALDEAVRVIGVPGVSAPGTPPASKSNGLARA